MANRAYNRRAFGKIAALTEPLPALYSALVRLELALKDHDPRACAQLGHNIIAMLQAVGAVSHLTVFESSLTSLWCSGRRGEETTVPVDRYPYVRYLLHHSDFSGRATDDDLLSVHRVVRDIEEELRLLGVAL